MKTTLSVLKPYRMISFQFFRDWCAQACVRAGMRQHWDFPLPWNLRLIIGKLGIDFPLFRRRKLLVMAGARPEYFCWPWCYFYEIIPVVWDCWPMWFPYLVKFVKRNNIRTVFCTSSITAKKLKDEVPFVDAVWLPEGVDIKSYPCGIELAKRTVDILEMGRIKKDVHDAIVSYSFNRPITHLYPEKKLLFQNQEALTSAMRSAKVTICYPRSDTDPKVARDIETLTQRYWEFMLSGTLIVGRAPRELIDVCGYNPVIELGEKYAEEVQSILNNIESYQALVDKNRKCAEIKGSWDARMSIIKEHLK